MAKIGVLNFTIFNLGWTSVEYLVQHGLSNSFHFLSVLILKMKAFGILLCSHTCIWVRFSQECDILQEDVEFRTVSSICICCVSSFNYCT